MLIDLTPEEANVLARALAALEVMHPKNKSGIAKMADKILVVCAPNYKMVMPDWWIQKKVRK